MFLTTSILSDILLIFLVGVFVLHVAFLKRKKRWFLFDPLNFFWVGVFLIYFSEAITGYSAYVSRYGESIVQATLFWIFFGMIFVHVGYYLRAGPRLARLVPALPGRIKPDALWLGAFALIIVGLFGWMIQIQAAGGLWQWASVPRGGRDWATASGYGNQLAALLTVGVALLVIHVELHGRGKAMKILAWGLLGLLLLFFLYLGTRSRTIMVVLFALMAWSLPRRQSPSWLLLAPLFAALFLVTSFQAEYRGHFRNFSFNFHEIDWSGVPAALLPSSFGSGTQVRYESRGALGSEFSITSAVVDLVPQDVPYAYGVEFLQFFTHPIPRAWWPDKRYPKNESWTPIHLAAGTSNHWVDYIKVPFVGGPAPGHVASWYYNGGAIGLIVGGLLVGMVLRFLRGIYDRGQNNESFLLVSFLSLPIGFGAAISHPFDWVYTAPLVMVPLVILLYLSRSRRQMKSLKWRLIK